MTLLPLWNVLPSQNVELLSHSTQKEEYLNVGFHKDFLRQWYCVILDSVQVIAQGTHDPVVGAVVCSQSWAKQSRMTSSSTTRPHLLGEMTEPLESWARGAEHQHKREQRKQEPLGGIFKPSFKTDDRGWKSIPSLKMSSETSSQLYPFIS